MRKFVYKLEKYSGVNSRHTCPKCNTRREFTRYVDANGNHLADDVGKCNRESKCGYHKKPKEYLAENSNLLNSPNIRVNNPNNPKPSTTKNTQCLNTVSKANTKIDLIPLDVFNNSLGNYDQNGFVKFLRDLFRDDIKAVQIALQRYYIGTWKDGLTIFWQVDKGGKIRTGKILRYDPVTGKRCAVNTWIEKSETRKLNTDWIHRTIKKGFNLKQCFFGEHLLQKEPEKIVAIVESEKTAVISSIYFPDMLWLAVGAKGYLSIEKLQLLSNRKILLFPDADAYSEWKEKALAAQRKGLDVRISNLIETLGTAYEKQNGFDLADYLINEQISINEYNEFVDRYNSALNSVLSSSQLQADFETILNEQKAILEIDGRLTEQAAADQVFSKDNLRKIVLSLGNSFQFE